MNCKACNAEMKKASDIYWREPEEGIKVMEDLCMTCRRRSYHTLDGNEHTEEDLLSILGIEITPSRGGHD